MPNEMREVADQWFDERKALIDAAQLGSSEWLKEVILASILAYADLCVHCIDKIELVSQIDPNAEPVR